MDNEKQARRFFIFCVIPLCIGIVFLLCSTDVMEYPTSEYWVASDFDHVYNKHNGQIEDYISDNEKCIIKGDTILVKTRKKGLFAWGCVLTGIWGTVTPIIFFNSEWWEDFKRCYNSY